MMALLTSGVYVNALVTPVTLATHNVLPRVADATLVTLSSLLLPL